MHRSMVQRNFQTLAVPPAVHYIFLIVTHRDETLSAQFSQMREPGWCHRNIQD